MKLEQSRRATATVASAFAALFIAMWLLPSAANATTEPVQFFGSQGGSCGGSAFVGQNLYNYPVASINTPADGYATCFATEAAIYWGNPVQATTSGLQGASAAAYGTPQGSLADYGYVLGCPGVYNCSGWVGPIFPGSPA